MAETTARTSVPSDQRVESTQLNRAVAALCERVAWLMSEAFRRRPEWNPATGLRRLGDSNGLSEIREQA